MHISASPIPIRSRFRTRGLWGSNFQFQQEVAAFALTLCVALGVPIYFNWIALGIVIGKPLKVACYHHPVGVADGSTIAGNLAEDMIELSANHNPLQAERHKGLGAENIPTHGLRLSQRRKHHPYRTLFLGARPHNQF